MSRSTTTKIIPQLAWRGLLVAALTVPCLSQSASVPISLDQWIIGEKNERLDPDRKVENNISENLGRQALHLTKGFGYVRGLDLQNGTIDADVAFDPNGAYIGLAFRVQAEDAYEMFFLRNGLSGKTQALQYTPGFFGANHWQIYNVPTYAGPGKFPSDQWFHIRVTVAGVQARLFLNNATEPSLVVPDLKQGYSSGSIGFWGQQGGGYISNLTYTPDNATYHVPHHDDYLPGTLTDWELSEIFDAAEKDPESYPDVRNLKWEKVKAENPGMVVIGRYRRDPNILPPDDAPGSPKPVHRTPGEKLVFARTTIHSGAPVLRKMNLGYSDEVVVFLNGRRIYAGSNAYGSREPGFLGLLNPDNEAIYLPLKKGDNDLVLAVAEFFGGWGLMCRLGE